MPQLVGVAEAKRRFSELLDRVGTGERIVVARRGKPAVALVPPHDELARGDRSAPTGFAAIAGALADWDELDDVVRDINAARTKAEDRPASTLE
ncbi:MAG: Antitoxin Phd YefM, type toxin-antitoxin system [Solirubrobacteraceae bacterium]|nr:Antitoxin Phd YefM, type toxin-antitoxin system [Solirubrobacteraceae bacterium]